MLNGAIALTNPSGPPSWLAPLSDSHHNGVVELAGCLESVDDPAEVLVEVFEHRGVGAGEPSEQTLFVGAVFIPGLHAEVAVG
jgi:hypothetical protein